MDITNGQKLLHILDSHCKHIAAEDFDNILSYHLLHKVKSIEHEKIKAMGLSGKSLLELILIYFYFFNSSIPDKSVIQSFETSFDQFFNGLYRNFRISDFVCLDRSNERNRYSKQYPEILYALIHQFYIKEGMNTLFELVTSFTDVPGTNKIKVKSASAIRKGQQWSVTSERQEQLMGYVSNHQFKSIKNFPIYILDAVLTHSSYFHGKQTKNSDSYEMLAILGSFVLRFAIDSNLLDNFDTTCSGKFDRFEKKRISQTNEKTLVLKCKEFLGMESLSLLKTSDIHKHSSKIYYEIFRSMIGALFLNNVSQRQPSPLGEVSEIVNVFGLEKAENINTEEIIRIIHLYETTGEIEYGMSIENLNEVLEWFVSNRKISSSLRTNEIIKQLRQLLVYLSEYRAGSVISSLIKINECFEQLCLLKVGNLLQENSRNSHFG